MDIPIYKDILMSSTFGFTYNKILLDEAGKPVDFEFLDVNPAYAEMLGLECVSITGKRVSEVLPDIKEDSFDWIACFGSVALGGERVEFEQYSRILDRWFHISVSSPGRFFFVGLSFDITEQKKLERKLQASEEKNRLYIENAPDSIFLADSSLKYIDANKAACNLLGYTKEELISLRLPDVIPPEDQTVHQESISQLLNDGYSRRTANLKRKDGTYVTTIIDSVCMQEGTLMAFCKDISDQTRLETEKNQYYSAFQTTPQPIMITDDKGTIVSVNAAFIEMYGYERSELLGLNPRILNPGRKVYENLGVSVFEYDSRFRDLWQAVTDPSIRTWRGELINKRKNDAIVWVSLLVNGVYGENGKLTSIVGLPIDMTVSHEVALNSRIQLYKTIADMAELRDDDTGNHMKRVGLFAKLMAREYGRSQKYCNDIEAFAPMHDIGKVGILDSILRAPRKLTNEEFEIMKTHTTLGHNIVKGKEEFEMAAAITLCHHERFDGSGYPNGLGGKYIPLSAHITAIADVYDALRSKRPYKDPWPHAKAVEHMQNSAETHFDPDLIRIFTTLQGRFESVFQELMD